MVPGPLIKVIVKSPVQSPSLGLCWPFDTVKDGSSNVSYIIGCITTTALELATRATDKEYS